MSAQPLVLYTRFSRLGTRENTITHQEQRREADRAVKHLDGLAIGHWVQESNRSAGTMDRSGLQDALAMVSSGQAGGIVFARLDRFSRDAIDAQVVARDIQQAGGKLVICDLSPALVDISDPQQLLVFFVKAWQAQEYRADKTKAGRAARRRAVMERGVHLANVYGYLRPARVNGEAQPLAIDPKAQGGVVLAHQMRAAGKSWNAIADQMNADYAVKPGGGWNWGRVRSMIIGSDPKQPHRVYLGQAKSGDFVKDDAHPAIIDEGLWETATAVDGRTRQPKADALLAGFVRCAGCGYRMVVSPTVKGQRYYKCRRRHRAGNCQETVNASEAQVNAVVLTELVDALDRIDVRGGTATDDRVADLQADIRREEMVFRTLQGDAPTTSRAQRLRTEALAESEARLDALDAKLVQAKLAVNGGRRLATDLSSDQLASLPLEEVREQLSICFGAVFIRRADAWREPMQQRVQIMPAGDPTLDGLPGPMNRDIAPRSWRSVFDPPDGARIAPAQIAAVS